jgi:hypothetical protein
VTHDELRALALAATPGPWSAHERPYMGWDIDPIEPGLRGMLEREADARYIAAANPATVLALLDDLTRLRAAARAFCQERTEAALLALMSEVER